MLTPLPLPRQLQRQAEDVARIEADLAEAKAQQNPETNAQPAPQPEGQEPPVAAAPPAPAPAAPNEWEQRYRTLDGKYRAEVPRLHQELKDLKALVDELKKPAAPAAPPPQETPRAEKKRLVTEKDAETFGPDLLDLIKRQAQEIADELVATRESTLRQDLQKLAAENEALRTQVVDVTKTQTASSQDQYLGKLAALVPDWETVNANPEFLAWLSETDPLSGLTRQAYLDHAYQTLDVHRTATLFTTWKSLKAPAAAPVTPAPTQDTPQRQVTPGKTRVAPAPVADPGQRIWTVAEIEKFYADARTGRLKPDELKRTEAEIDLAVSTGRVRQK